MLPKTFNNIAIFSCILSNSARLVVFPVTFVLNAFLYIISSDSMAADHAKVVLAAKNFTVCEIPLAVTMHIIILKLPDKFRPVELREMENPVAFAVGPLAIVDITDAIAEYADSVELVVLESPAVLVISGHQLAGAVLDSVRPLAVIHVIVVSTRERPAAMSQVVVELPAVSEVGMALHKDASAVFLPAEERAVVFVPVLVEDPLAGLL